MTVLAVCRIDHSPEGAMPGYVIESFPDQQSASNRGLEESYPRCSIEYVDTDHPLGLLFHLYECENGHLFVDSRKGGVCPRCYTIMTWDLGETTPATQLSQDSEPVS